MIKEIFKRLNEQIELADEFERLIEFVKAEKVQVIKKAEEDGYKSLLLSEAFVLESSSEYEKGEEVREWLKLNRTQSTALDYLLDSITDDSYTNHYSMPLHISGLLRVYVWKKMIENSEFYPNLFHREEHSLKKISLEKTQYRLSIDEIIYPDEGFTEFLRLIDSAISMIKDDMNDQTS